MVTVRFLNGMALTWAKATTWSHSGEFLLILKASPAMPDNIIASVHSPGGCVVEAEPPDAVQLPANAWSGIWASGEAGHTGR